MSKTQPSARLAVQTLALNQKSSDHGASSLEPVLECLPAQAHGCNIVETDSSREMSMSWESCVYTQRHPKHTALTLNHDIAKATMSTTCLPEHRRDELGRSGYRPVSSRMATQRSIVCRHCLGKLLTSQSSLNSDRTYRD